MDANTYQKLALRTESTLSPLSALYAWGNEHRLLHAAMGLATESGEFLDPIKKLLFYGKEIDIVNLKEEIGDILWYLAIACDALETTIAVEMERNIAKLFRRYPNKFTKEDATERDLFAEREALEKSVFENQIQVIDLDNTIDARNFAFQINTIDDAAKFKEVNHYIISDDNLTMFVYFTDGSYTEYKR